MRLTRGFQDAIWDEIKNDVVVVGNMANFGQYPKLKHILFDTGDRLLAEAASLDRTWGIGYTAHEAMIHQHEWGEIMLETVLMEVRRRLQQEKD